MRHQNKQQSQDSKIKKDVKQISCCSAFVDWFKIFVKCKLFKEFLYKYLKYLTCFQKNEDEVIDWFFTEQGSILRMAEQTNAELSLYIYNGLA